MIDVYKFLKRNINIELIWNKNGNQITFKSNIKYVFDDRLFLTNPQNSSEKFDSVNIFEKLKVVICTEEGVLSGSANLLEKNANENGDVFISFPYNNEFSQRRENSRIPMHVDFNLYFDESQILELKTKNISGKGLACITDLPLPDFTGKKLTLNMPSGKISVICRKVYSKKLEPENDNLFLNGIEFTEISNEAIKAILQDCLKFQMDSKHNERLFETL